MDGELSMDHGSMVHDAMEDIEGVSSKDTQLVSCRLFLHGCDLDLETLIGAGEQRFKELAFELG